MVGTFAGKRCFLTGAASGIGRATALLLARDGAELYLTDRDAAGLEQTVADARALGRDGRSHGGNGKRRYCKTDERFVQCHGRLLSDWCGHEVNVAKN